MVPRLSLPAMTRAAEHVRQGRRTTCRKNDSHLPAIGRTSIFPAAASMSIKRLLPIVPMMTALPETASVSRRSAGLRDVTRSMSDCKSPAARMHARPVLRVHVNGGYAVFRREGKAAGLVGTRYIWLLTDGKDAVRNKEAAQKQHEKAARQEGGAPSEIRNRLSNTGSSSSVRLADAVLLGPRHRLQAKSRLRRSTSLDSPGAQGRSRAAP